MVSERLRTIDDEHVLAYVSVSLQGTLGSLCNFHLPEVLKEESSQQTCHPVRPAARLQLAILLRCFSVAGHEDSHRVWQLCVHVCFHV